MIVGDFMLHPQAEFSRVSNEAAQLYREETPMKKQSASGLRDAAEKAIKELKSKLGPKFSKNLAIADPKNSPEFLDEVCPFSSCSQNVH